MYVGSCGQRHWHRELIIFLIFFVNIHFRIQRSRYPYVIQAMLTSVFEDIRWIFHSQARLFGCIQLPFARASCPILVGRLQATLSLSQVDDLGVRALPHTFGSHVYDMFYNRAYLGS